MYRLARQGLGLIAGALLIQTGVMAGDPPDAGGDPTIAELMRRIERLEQDKIEMHDEIDELKTQLVDDWLTEERAQQIRHVVEDVLVDADTRSSLLQDGLTAGWDEHFFLASADGRFRLDVGGMIQTRWIWNYHDAAPDYRYGFEVPRAKLIFGGYVFSPDMTFRIQGDFAAPGGGVASTFGLEDAWFRYYINNEWAIRMGQFKLPFNREELVYSGNQQVIERSLLNESLNIGRSVGIELLFADRDNRFDLALSNGGNQDFSGFSLIPTNPIQSPLVLDTDWAVTLRYERKIAGSWQQFRQFTSPPGDGYGMLVGVAGHYQRNNPATPAPTRDDVRWLAATADASVQWGGANLFAQALYHYIDAPLFNVAILGLSLQGGTYFTEKLEGYARFEYGRFYVNGEGFLEDLILLTLGANYYFDGQDIKFSADIGFGINPVSQAWNNNLPGWRADPGTTAPQIVIRTQLQLLF